MDLQEKLDEVRDKWFEYINFDVIVTQKCNCRCLHCLLTNYTDEMPFARFERIIKEFTSMQVAKINLTGGEIFFHPDIDRILDLLKEYKQYVGAVTNGTSMSAAIMKKIKAANISLGLSLDGPEEYHDYLRQRTGVYKSVIETIRLTKEFGVRLAIVSCITKENLKHLDWLVNFCLEHKINTMRIQPVQYFGHAKNLYTNNLFVDSEDTNFMYKFIINNSAKYIGRLNLLTVGRFKSEILAHKCKFGLAFGSDCHSNSIPIPQGITIAGNGKIHPFSNYISTRACIGSIDKGIKTALESFYGSPIHLGLFKLYKEVFEEEILNKADDYFDIGLTMSKKLDSIDNFELYLKE